MPNSYVELVRPKRDSIWVSITIAFRFLMKSENKLSLWQMLTQKSMLA